VTPPSRPTASPQWLLVGAVDKLAEACFFLRKLDEAAGWVECSYYASAFGSACYSVRDLLAKVAKADAAWREWWSTKEKTLWASPLHSYFHHTRNADIHEGCGFVEGVSMTLRAGPAGLELTETPLAKDTAQYTPGDLVTECSEYFGGLVRLAAETYRTVAPTLDPDGQLRQSILSLEADASPLH
jgi:hypothetical protein